MRMIRSRTREAPPEPYWRQHERALRNGRLAWYGEAPDDEFWAELWQSRLDAGYFQAADDGDLEDLGPLLTAYLDRDGRHLEAGCGLGYWVAALRSHGYRIEGVDSSRSLVAAVKQARPDLPIRHGDATHLVDYEDASIDGYLSFGVVEHREAGPEPFLAEAARVVRPNGVIVISVPFLCPLRRLKARLRRYPSGPSEGRPFFQYAFAAEEFQGLVTDAGFEIVAVHHQQVQRCLVEEVPLYFRLNRRRGARHLRRLVVAAAPASWTAHMVLFVGRRRDAEGMKRPRGRDHATG